MIRSLEQLIYPIAYMMLEAESLDIKSCIIGAMGNEVTGVLSDVYAKVKSQLGLGEGQIISSIITLGYEAEPVEINKKRKDFDEVVSLEKLGNKF